MVQDRLHAAPGDDIGMVLKKAYHHDRTLVLSLRFLVHHYSPLPCHTDPRPLSLHGLCANNLSYASSLTCI